MHNDVMPTPSQTIRVSVPVTPQVLEKFQRFAAVSGLSVGKSMGDWLRDTMGGLEAMTEILEVHKTRPGQAIAQLQDLAASLQTLTTETTEIMKTAEPGGRAPLAGRGRQAEQALADAAQSPRLVIRGVKSQTVARKSRKAV